MSNCKSLISKLEQSKILEKEEFVELISQHTGEDALFLFERARAVRELFFGKSVYLRGLKLPTIVQTTVITVESGVATTLPNATD